MRTRAGSCESKGRIPVLFLQTVGTVEQDLESPKVVDIVKVQKVDQLQHPPWSNAERWSDRC